jgi:hypothetical protein
LKGINLKSHPLPVATAGILIVLIAQWIPYVIFLTPVVIMILLDMESPSSTKVITLRSLYVFGFAVIAYSILSNSQNIEIFGILLSSIAAGLTALTYLFFKKNIGNRLGQFTFLILWMGFIYSILKLSYFTIPVFFSDIFRQSNFSWTFYTGYLGLEVWIFWVGFNFYTALFRTERIVYGSVLFALFLLCLPLIGSHFIEAEGISKQSMISHYTGASQPGSNYFDRGEWMARTSAWLSVLLLTFSFVKFKTGKFQ